MVKIYGLYNRPEVKGIEFVEPSMAQNQFLYECDLNNIVDANLQFKDPAFVEKMKLAGKWSDKTPQYGDFTKSVDYQEALNVVNEANEQFSYLPAKVRDKFKNNPAEMLAFVEKASQDQSVYSEGIELGLFEDNSILNTVNPQVAGVDTVSAPASETSA